MANDIVMSDEDVRAAEGYDSLGPAYFAARRMSEALMAGAESEPLKKVADRVTDDITTAVYQYVEDHLRADLESNLQSHICNAVEYTVRALLTGQEWAMRQYPFTDYSKGEDVRTAVAKHGGDELLMKRIADLEKENARMREDLTWYRNR